MWDVVQQQQCGPWTRSLRARYPPESGYRVTRMLRKKYSSSHEHRISASPLSSCAYPVIQYPEPTIATMGSAFPDEIPHPFDPLGLGEIEKVVALVKKAYGDVFFNVVSLHEPRKAEMMTWLEKPSEETRPPRIADVVVIAPGGSVYDGLVDLKDGSITKWELMPGVQPIVSSSIPPSPKRLSPFTVTG
jgi:Cu2+-containing amine oxidase